MSKKFKKAEKKAEVKTELTLEELQAKIEAMKAEQARLQAIEDAKPPVREEEIKSLVAALDNVSSGCTVSELLDIIKNNVKKLCDLDGTIVPTGKVSKKTGSAVSVYGHKINSMSAIIDKMLVKGSTFIEIQEAIQSEEKFKNKELRLIVNKISSHISYLGKHFFNGKGIQVVEKNGVYKSSFIS